MGRLTKVYVDLLKRYPAATKITSGAILVGLGDGIAQGVIEKSNHWDHERTLRFAGIAFFVITPMTRTWVDLILPKLVPPIAKNASKNSSTVIAVKKVVLDMLIFGPPVSTTMVGLNMYLSMKPDWSVFVDKMCNEQPGIIASAWCYWGPMQFINFRFIPPHLQASYIQVAALFWNTYLSYRAHQNIHSNARDTTS